MTAIVTGIVAALLAMVAESLLASIQAAIMDLPSWAFTVPDLIDGALGTGLTATLGDFFIGTGTLLMTIAFLSKGFGTYILYDSGDPDTDPLQLLTLYFKGIAVITGGGFIIDFFSKVVNDLLTSIMNIFKNILSFDEGSWKDCISSMLPEDPDELIARLLMIVFVIIFSILFWIMFFTILKDGLELWIIKVGLPLACVGLINADKGIFKNYVMSIAKILVTILVKISLCHMGFTLIVACQQVDGTGFIYTCFGVIMGIVCMIMAFSAPKLLQEFMVAGGGGNGMMKTYYTYNMARSILGRK